MDTKNHYTNGFTLMEMLVVLALVGVLAVIALPSFAQQIKQGRVTSNANQLHSVYKFARSEAAKRNEQINLVVVGKQWRVKMGAEVLSVFEPSHDSITISNLSDLTINSMGSTSNIQFQIQGADDTTDNYSLCIYISGQSKLVKGALCS
ncbi:GspH/FimT family pseudopilin [Psychromonas sp.]|nr:GspH/FimT family pseudopilin [Psychromonas sp.]